MNTKTILLWFVVGVVVLGALIYSLQWQGAQAPAEQAIKVGPLDTTYTVEQQQVRLTDGRAEQQLVPDSASKLVTAVFGEPTSGDLNRDGLTDAVLILTQDSGGSGTFFYVAAALQQADGNYSGTNSLFLGDRIAPQNITINDGLIEIDYARPAEGEAMSDQPSTDVSEFFKISGNVLYSRPGLE